MSPADLWLPPDPDRVAITDAVDADMLVVAYRAGAFPWHTQPVGWYAPRRRAIMPPGAPRLPSNLPRLFRGSGCRLSLDTAFVAVMAACREAHLALGHGAWIDRSLIAAYGELAARGQAHSVEVWAENQLVGGLYGVQLGRMFAAESMFHRRPNASKFALAALAWWLPQVQVVLWDVQVLNPTTARLGAKTIGRDAFRRRLATALKGGRPPERWPPEPPGLAELFAPADGRRAPPTGGRGPDT